MAKKQKQKQKKKSSRRTKHRPKSRGLKALWRRHQTSMRRFMVWGLPIIVLLFAIIMVASWFTGRAKTAEKAEYTALARQQLLRGDLQAAEVSYHIASNADPDDKGLMREATMLKAKIDMSTGGSVENAIAAARSVIAYDSASVVAHITLAQLCNRRGDMPRLRANAAAALAGARSSGDTLGMLISATSLSSFYRQIDQYDSSYQLAKEAADWAAATGNRVDSAVTASTLGFSALEVGDYDLARGSLAELERLGGHAYEPFYGLTQIGWADYYYRTGDYDSSLMHSSYILDLYRDQEYNLQYASAAHLQGKALAAKGENEKAIEMLRESLAAWQAVSGYSDLIDNFNDLAEVYLAERDYADARANYIAASKLASAYGVPDKSELTMNLNTIFLKNLAPDVYLAAGKLGDSLAAGVKLDMELLQ